MVKRTYKILRFNTVLDTVTLTSTTAIDHEIALSEYKRNILPSNCWMEEVRETSSKN